MLAAAWESATSQVAARRSLSSALEGETTVNISSLITLKEKKRQQRTPSPIFVVIKPDLPRVLLKRNRQSKAFRDGSQLVYTGSITSYTSSSCKVQVKAKRTAERDTWEGLRLGDIVQVEVPVANVNDNRRGNERNSSRELSKEQWQQQQTQVVGWGVYNPHSMYRVRILCHAVLGEESLKRALQRRGTIPAPKPPDLLLAMLAVQLGRAVATRKALGLPSKDVTDTYRLVNGEGDGLSGLAIDVVGGTIAVVMSSAAWCEIHKPAILESLAEVLPSHTVVWKTDPSRLKQDGYNNIAKQTSSDGNRPSFPATTEKALPVIALENEIRYQIFPDLCNQKTGVYCDQRENRLHLGRLCKGKRVLDLCCYHGGFSLNAATHAASHVVGVDSSQSAINACRANAKLNDLANVTEFVREDIANFMQREERTFDVVVLDPPKLAPSAAGLSKATRKYHSFNRNAMALIDRSTGGLFLTCTCSAAMTQKNGGNYFLSVVQGAAIAARRDVTLLKICGAAPCHTRSPTSFPPGNYLTAALFYVHAVPPAK